MDQDQNRFKREKEKMVSISLRLSEESLKLVDELAEYADVDRSVIIRVFINDGLANSGKANI